MGKTIPDKIPDFTLTRKAKHSYIVGTKIIKGEKPGQYSQTGSFLADGEIKFYPNSSAEEEAINKRRLAARETKQILDAVKNKKIFEDRAKLSKSAFIVTATSAVVMWLSFLLGAGVASLSDSVANLLGSSNALAYLGIVAALVSIASTFVYDEKQKRQKTLTEVKKYEMFLNNKSLIHEHQKKPVIILGGTPAIKAELRRVTKAEPLSIHNLHVLSYMALVGFIENIDEHIASQDPSYEYIGDTIGASECYADRPKILSLFPNLGKKSKKRALK